MWKGEIAHLSKDWVDLEEQIISIAVHEPCDKGKDGGLCGYCRQLAKLIAEHNDIQFEDATDFYWKAKTEEGEREISYDFDDRCAEVIEEFFDRFDEYYNSATAIHRRLNAAIEAADNLKVNGTSPHGLRAAAASHLVMLGLNAWSLQRFMEWA